MGMDFCSKGHVDVRVFHPNASSCYTSKPHTHGKVKTREYGKHIREAEHGLFTPLHFSTSGTQLLEKQNEVDAVVMGLVKVPSLILPYCATSAIMCLQGSRSSYHHPVYCDLTLAVHEGRVNYMFYHLI